MFQMNCSQCGGLIKSSRLCEIQVIKCPHCKEIVNIRNVVVSTKSLAIDFRSSLKKVLLSARDNFRLNRAQALDTPNRHEINRRLARLLRRDDFRLDMSYGLYVQINFENQKRLARLMNISSTGAGIEFAERGQVPEDTSEHDFRLPDESAEVNFQLPLPGSDDCLQLPGRVVWSKIPEGGTLFPTITMGLQFEELNEQTRSRLWEFIVSAEKPATEGH